jgi:hypothetical protein
MPIHHKAAHYQDFIAALRTMRDCGVILKLIVPTATNTTDLNHPLCGTLAAIIAAHPNLGLSGFYQPGLSKPFTPADAPEHAVAFGGCVEVLRLFHCVALPAAAPDLGAWTYDIKDAMLAYARLRDRDAVVHHGHVICAALFLGATDRRMRDGISIAVGIESAFVERAINRWQSIAAGRPVRPRSAADVALDEALGIQHEPGLYAANV